MHTKDDFMGLSKSPESPSSTKENEKEKRHYALFHRKTQPSLRASEHDLLGDQDNNTAPARTAVFNTNELLYEILSKVPLNHFASLRRVSKTWNSVVDQVGYFVEPVRFRTDSFPEYSETISFTFNPVFGRLPQKPTRPSREHYAAHYQVDHLFPTHNLRRLGPLGDQFLTNPPITHLKLTAYPAASSLLKVQDGNRLRDLAEALDAVPAPNRRGKFGMFRRTAWTFVDFEMEHHEKCGGCVVGVHLHCVKRESPRRSNSLSTRILDVLRRKKGIE